MKFIKSGIQVIKLLVNYIPYIICTLLIIAILPFEYEYYIFLRYAITFLIFIYLLKGILNKYQVYSLLGLIGIMFLFNPFYPILSTKGFWIIVDLSIVIFIIFMEINFNDKIDFSFNLLGVSVALLPLTSYTIYSLIFFGTVNIIFLFLTIFSFPILLGLMIEELSFDDSFKPSKIRNFFEKFNKKSKLKTNQIHFLISIFASTVYFINLIINTGFEWTYIIGFFITPLLIYFVTAPILILIGIIDV